MATTNASPTFQPTSYNHPPLKNIKIGKKAFERFVKELSEPEKVISRRKIFFERFQQAPPLSFRRGQNIVVEPEGFHAETFVPGKPPEVHKNIQYNPSSGVELFSGAFFPPFFGRRKTENFTEPFFKMTEKKQNSEPEIKKTQEEVNSKLWFYNEACANDLVFIRIPRNFKVKEPIEVTYDLISKGSQGLISQIYILAEQNAQATIFLSKVSQGIKQEKQDRKNKNMLYVSDDIRVIAHPGSDVEIVTLQHLDSDAVAIQRRQAQVKRSSRVSWIDICLGSGYTQSQVVSDLREEGSETAITVLYFGTARQRFDVYTAAHHHAPHTKSDIMTKGVVSHQAKAVSRGHIHIGKNAFGASGYEKQDVLLLSDEAEADAIPHLTINNHDVQCSHGSTIGHIDEEKIFYLKSRGIDEKTAKQLIIEGYFTPVISKYCRAHTKPLVEEALKQALHGRGNREIGSDERREGQGHRKATKAQEGGRDVKGWQMESDRNNKEGLPTIFKNA